MGQLRRAGPGGAAPGQPGRPHVEDGDTAGHAAAARFAQHRAVADPQRQRPVQGEPGDVLAERADGHRDGGGAEVQGQRAGQVGDRLPGDPGVDHVGVQPAVRGQQHLPAPQIADGRTVHVDGDAGHPAHLRPLLAQALQPAHPEHGRAAPGDQPVADAQRARAEGAGHHGAVTAHGERPVQPQA
ncbi:hypothetical protein [Streptomyces cellostaticus]|uniref:hypothetical protein n=1 Tax=Streptomyces cellostaticus TaxID=67285 RepID=UPI001FC9224F|nr:hypothetical protein [Streptomyces cellostaticus]